jgi:Fic family protein
MVIHYLHPKNWISYDVQAVANALVEAKSVVLSLKTIPYQRGWVEALQKMQLKREVAGTSRIEGAEFTDRELEVALKETAEQLLTRSQRQAHAAMQAYRWIATIPDDRPITADLICEIHRRIVTGADDDHCPAGKIRERDQNVTFGSPRHRGAEGGDECRSAFTELAHAIEHQLKEHDPIVQALAAHYHFAAMHPFLDGNGRTARALEALLLARAGLRETCFIAMSNYYYDEKTSYLATLAKVRGEDNDLTQFLVFGLKGIAIQARRLLQEIQHQISRELFRNLMFHLFHRLKTPRKRIIAERQIEILKLLLDVESMELEALIARTAASYKGLKDARTAVIRDLNALIGLGAIGVAKTGDQFHLGARLEWPTEITETQFFAQLKKLPKAKTHSFLP